MGPWSRSFIATVAGNAERPELEVEDLRIEPGKISARVDGCEVTLTAAPIPQRIWTALHRYAQGMGQLEDAVDGRIQSVHLEHLLEEDWDEQLIPRPRAIAQACECDVGAGCEHVVALAYTFADDVERSPGVVLRWRGVTGAAEPDGVDAADPWQGRELSAPGAARVMPTHAVLHRLGRTDMPVSRNKDLAAALRPGYEVLFSRTTT